MSVLARTALLFSLAASLAAQSGEGGAAQIQPLWPTLRPVWVLGQARLANGEPWTDASVRVRALDPHAIRGTQVLFERNVSTDRAGRFRARVPRGVDFVVTVRDAGGRTAMRHPVRAGQVVGIEAEAAMSPWRVRVEGARAGWQLWSTELDPLAVAQQIPLSDGDDLVDVHAVAQSEPFTGRANQLFALVDEAGRLRALRIVRDSGDAVVELRADAWKRFVDVRVDGDDVDGARLVLYVAGGEAILAEGLRDGSLRAPMIPPMLRSQLRVQGADGFEAEVHAERSGALFAQMVPAAVSMQLQLTGFGGLPLESLQLVQRGRLAVEGPGAGFTDRYERIVPVDAEGVVKLRLPSTLVTERIDLRFGPAQQEWTGLWGVAAIVSPSKPLPSRLDLDRLELHDLQVLGADGVPTPDVAARLATPGGRSFELHPDATGRVAWVSMPGEDRWLHARSGFALGRRAAAECRPGKSGRRIRWQLPAPTPVRLAVQRGGQPAGALEVLAKPVADIDAAMHRPEQFPGTVIQSRTTDSAGRCVVQLSQLWPIWRISVRGYAEFVAVDLRDPLPAEVLIPLSR